MRAALLLAALALASQAWARPFGPSDYETCVLENLKGTSGDRAAAMVAQACRKRFPLPPEPAKQYARPACRPAKIGIGDDPFLAFENPPLPICER